MEGKGDKNKARRILSDRMKASERWKEREEQSPQQKIVSSFPILGSCGGESSSLKLEMEPDT